MKVNWKNLRKKIPNRVRTKARTHYEVLWSDEFWFDEKTGKKTYGTTRFDPNLITLNINQGDKETIHTYFHEYIHALSVDYNLDLTETQVENLEKAFPYVREFILMLEGKNKRGKK
jgi:hypothetical protein